MSYGEFVAVLITVLLMILVSVFIFTAYYKVLSGSRDPGWWSIVYMSAILSLFSFGSFAGYHLFKAIGLLVSP